MRKALVIPIAGLCILALFSAAACRDSFNPADQLTVVVTPCVAYQGSDVDPCERRGTWENPNPFQFVEYVFPEVYPSVEDELLYVATIGNAVHFIVRSTVIPGTTRCVKPEFRYRLYWLRDDTPRDPLSPLLQCVTDIAVNEYIVGRGPARLTVHTRIQNFGCSDGDEPCGWRNAR